MPKPVQARLLVAVLALSCGVAVAGESAPRAVIIAQNSGTEITDLLVPFAILAAAAVNVEIVSTDSGPVNLMHGLELLNLRTISDLDLNSLDLVVVPAVHEPADPRLGQWLAMAATGKTLVASICDGVEVLAAAGILDGHKATGHFYSKNRRQAKHPAVSWVENTRYVHDGNIISTAGVSASAPASIYLASLLVGEDIAHKVAKRYGVDFLDGSKHSSEDFSVGLHEIFVGARNFVLGLRKKKYNLIVGQGTDEFAFAFMVDSLGRTYRTSMGIDAPGNIVQTANGLEIRGKPAYSVADWDVDLRVALNRQTRAASIKVAAPDEAIAKVFQHIELEYGRETARFVGLQLELPNRGLAPDSVFHQR